MTLAIDVIQNAGLDAAEAEVQAVLFQKDSGELNGVGVAFLGQLIDQRTAGIAQSQYAGNLVKGFAHGIIAGTSQHFEAVISLDIHDVSMSSADHQSHERRLQIRRLHVIGTDMSLNVMYAHQRLSCGKRHSLGMGQTDQKCTHQSGTAGDTDQIHVVDGDPCLIQCLLIDTIDVA